MKQFDSNKIRFLLSWGAALAVLLSFPAPLLAAENYQDGGYYSIDMAAAEPTQYLRLTPGSLACPGSGRVADPLTGAQHWGGVESLAPAHLGLGQIVAFEFLVSVGSGAPANGSIEFTAGWSTQTTSNVNFGYDEAYGVYCAFVDPADGSAYETDSDAAVSGLSWAVVGDEIQGTITVSGLDPNEQVIVEVWMVLDENIPSNANGNVQSRLISARTVPVHDTISTGNQTIPLNKIQDFFSSPADISVVKSDAGAGTRIGQQFTYTLLVTNHSASTVANEVLVTDSLDPHTAFVSTAVTDSQGAPTTCSYAAGAVTCDLHFMNPGEVVTIYITVEVLPTAPTGFHVENGTCSQASPTADLCNLVSVASLSDNVTTNDSDSEPTDVINPDLTIVKTASPTIVLVGDEVVYTYAVSNFGEDAVHAVTVADDKCSPVTYVSGDDGDGLLEPGETWLYTCSDHLFASTTNVATASATDPLGNSLGAQDSAYVEVIQTGIGISKSVDRETVYVGDTVHYTYEVVNAGQYPILSVAVSDDQCGPVTYVGGDSSGDNHLDPSEVWTYTCTDVLLVDTLNTGTAGGTDSLGNVLGDSDTAFVDVIDPAIQVTVSADPHMVYSGDAVAWEVVVTNTGDDPLTDVTLTDDNGYPYSVIALAVGESYTFTYTTNPTADVTNVVDATGTDSLGGTVSDTDSDAVDVIHPAIDVAITATPPTIYSGNLVAWEVVVTNTGDDLLAGVTLVDDNGYSYPIFDLAVGESRTFNYTTNPTADVTNVVDATGTDSLGGAVSDSDSDAVDVIHPDIQVVVSADPNLIDSGDAVLWTVVVTNIGDDPLTGVTLTDDNGYAYAPIALLSVGASYTFIYTTNPTADVTNIVDASATDSLGGPVGDTDNDSVDVIHPAIDVTITADPTLIHSGDAVAWEVVVTNTGDDPLTGVTLVDDNGYSYPVFDLAVGESRTFNYTTNPTADVTNVVDASGTDSLGGAVSDSDSDAVDVIGPDISITASGPALGHEGDLLTYDVTVENTGNTALTVDVPLPDGSHWSGSLLPGASATFTATDTASAGADPHGIDLVATGVDTLGGVVTDNDPVSTDILHPLIDLTVTAGDSQIDEGESTILVYQVTNTSADTTLYDVVVTADNGTPGDPSDDYVVCVIDELAAGATAFCQETVTPIDDATYAGTAAGHDALDGPAADQDDALVDVIHPIPDPEEEDPDSDGDGISDYQDSDDDNDGIPDSDEGAGDSDGDGIPDYLDTDSDNDGIPDGDEGAGDSDGDGIPDYLDTDSDNDGIPDGDEGNGDSDGDGVPDYLDTDSDNDGISDQIETADDADGDGVGNYLDDDSDGDGISDEIETAADADGDGIPNFLDGDSDGDGIPDGIDGTGDADGDGIPNWLDPEQRFTIFLPLVVSNWR